MTQPSFALYVSENSESEKAYRALLDAEIPFSRYEGHFMAMRTPKLETDKTIYTGLPAILRYISQSKSPGGLAARIQKGDEARNGTH